MARKNALGRGLGALITDANSLSSAPGASISEIDIGLIEVNPFQPRSKINEEGLVELASSISELGIIQPITVRKTDGEKFQLITGERRFKASRIAGLKKIPAYIRTADDQGMLEMALVENIQREDLNSIEVAISYQRLLEECSLTQESLSDRVGKKRATISNYLRLLKLPPEIQLGIRDRKLSMGHARPLINIQDPKLQIQVYYRIIDEELPVRRIEDIVRELSQIPKEDKLSKKLQLAEEYKDLKDHLSKYFKTSVEFRRNEKGKGKIVIPFETDDELERIVGVFDRLNS